MHAVIGQFDEPVVDILSVRKAQSLWAGKSVGERLRVIRRLRSLIAENANLLATTAAAVSQRPVAEKLVCEVLPLADGCKWLEKNAARILRRKKFGWRGRPFWLGGARFEIQRQPFGVVLIIAPRNYPLFLPAIQALQALAACNAVLIKPAPGTRQVSCGFVRLARQAGLERSLLVALPENERTVDNSVRAGIDKVIFTGSSKNGRKILYKLASTNTPAVMELAGEDAMIVLSDADPDLVIQALNFGTQLNGGETCIAPRRLIVEEPIAKKFLARLMSAGLPNIQIQRVPNADAALEIANGNEYGLGASIFSQDLGKARSLAARIKSGFVTINDIIVPTADPRFPFGGTKASGFGVTRGEAGLLEMTHNHVVSMSREKSRRHLGVPNESLCNLFLAYIKLFHGKAADRWSSAFRFFKASATNLSKRS
jgi:acyl-CoA reductase-like NAD-dependent aldehyde dehydrogenase